MSRILIISLMVYIFYLVFLVYDYPVKEKSHLAGPGLGNNNDWFNPAFTCIQDHPFSYIDKSQCQPLTYRDRLYLALN